MARTPKVVEDRREQILDAALCVFSQKGFTRSTNKDIAHEAGITPGLIYHYFTSKEAVLKAVVEERSPLYLLRSLPPEVFALPPAQFLHLLVPQVLARLEGEQFVQVIRLLLPEIIHNVHLSPIVGDTFAQALNFLEQYFSAKIERAELRSADPVLVAQTFVGCIIGFILRRQILRDPVVLEYTHEQITNIIIDTVLNGLLPR